MSRSSRSGEEIVLSVSKEAHRWSWSVDIVSVSLAGTSISLPRFALPASQRMIVEGDDGGRNADRVPHRGIRHILANDDRRQAFISTRQASNFDVLMLTLFVESS